MSRKMIRNGFCRHPDHDDGEPDFRYWYTTADLYCICKVHVPSISDFKTREKYVAHPHSRGKRSHHETHDAKRRQKQKHVVKQSTLRSNKFNPGMKMNINCLKPRNCIKFTSVETLCNSSETEKAVKHYVCTLYMYVRVVANLPVVYIFEDDFFFF